jgi:hypothetical protein
MLTYVELIDAILSGLQDSEEDIWDAVDSTEIDKILLSSLKEAALYKPNSINVLLTTDENKLIDYSLVTDYVRLPTVCEYPLLTLHNLLLKGNKLEIQTDDTPTDGDSVRIYFDKRHKVSQLTDFVAAVDNGSGYAAGTTTMAIKGLASADTLIERDQEFTIAGLDETYTITADATITTNTATITFFPGLEDAVLDDAVITLTESTLTPDLEEAIIQLSVAKGLMSKPILTTNQINVSASVTQEWYKIGSDNLALARQKLSNLSPPSSRLYKSYSR